MRVVFLGTPEFAVPSLLALLKSAYEVCAVFTQPDRPTGRGQRVQPPPVKVCAQEAGIPVFQPERIRSDENRALFNSFKADFIVVVAYGQILPTWLLKSARVAPVNVHGSLLPRYRGAAPIVWAILNGESVTGVTTMWMDEHLDTGDILLARQVPVDDMATAGELASELARVGAGLLIPTLDGLRSGSIVPAPQDSRLASYAPLINKEMARISWVQRARDIHNRIRAFNPWPIAYAEFQGQRLMIHRSLLEKTGDATEHAPGTYLGCSGDGLRIQCAEGTVLQLLDLQVAGRRRVSGREFANGARLRIHVQLFPSDHSEWGTAN